MKYGKPLNEVLDLFMISAAKAGYRMVGFQQVVGVVVELYLVDTVVGIEAVEKIILCCGCAAGEQGDEDEEYVFEVLHN